MGSSVIAVMTMFFMGFPDKAPWFMCLYWLLLTWWVLIDMLVLYRKAAAEKNAQIKRTAPVGAEAVHKTGRD